jgi:Ca2+/Na+ antiporter
MQQYIGFFILLALIFIIVLFNKSLLWWVKGIIIAYYLVVAYRFITVKNRIDKEFEDVLPVPEAYWDQNSGWVSTITGYLFWPLVGILVFIYIKWFLKVRSKLAKVLILVSIIPAAILFLFFSFMFSFTYGYRP